MSQQEPLLRKKAMFVSNTNYGSDQPVEIEFDDGTRIQMRPSELRQKRQSGEISEENSRFIFGGSRLKVV